MGVIECPNTFIHVVRPHYAIMTGGVCGAILMNYFEQWQISVGLDKWFFRNQEDMERDLFGMFTVRQIRNEIDALVENNLVLWRNNPIIGQIKTRQYRLNIPVVQKMTDDIYENEGKPYIIGAKVNFEGAESEPSKYENSTFKVQNLHLQGAESAPSNNRNNNRTKKQKHGTDSTTQENTLPRDVVVEQLSDRDKTILLKLEGQGIKAHVARTFKGLPEKEIDKAIAESSRMANPVGFLVKALKQRWYQTPVEPYDVIVALGYKYSFMKGFGWWDEALAEKKEIVLEEIRAKSLEMGIDPDVVFDFYRLVKREFREDAIE